MNGCSELQSLIAMVYHSTVFLFLRIFHHTEMHAQDEALLEWFMYAGYPVKAQLFR